jgi:hypothetical protein
VFKSVIHGAVVPTGFDLDGFLGEVGHGLISV